MIQLKNSVILCIFAASILGDVAKSQSTNSPPIVSTEYGKVEGFRHTTPSGFETEVFLGIPYAAPPIGNLRFEKPIPPTPWTTTRQAKSFGAACASVPRYSPATASEDCLFMNIIKPTAPSSDPKGYPVMLWIHGGGFIAGSSADYPYNGTAERIVEKGVIYASINYRQAAFGFFTTGNSKAPGNYGLWDQVQALKFIQKVIKKFGGNPKNVTPFAQSSGAIGLSLLSLSPKTKDLFIRSIDMSGTSNIRLELSTKDINASLQLADAVGCGCASNPKICLKTKTAAEIQAGMGTFITYLMQGDGTAFPGSFSPRADGDLIPNIKYEKLIKRASKRDVLMGFNSQEWYVFGK
uniref:Carboxylesterase type B domain-containing protein n=1 Tax=Panagrolaimus superbus TaxID=310955 RepID=A0A914Y4J6_9BILA